MYMMNDREFSNRKETLHGEFYENALKYPERIALIYENEKVSYKMLRLYALRAANYMWQRGVRRNDKIVVILPRGIGQVAALLGILAIGAAYVPIAMKQPLGRRKKIIENVKPALVLQDEAFLEDTHTDHLKIPCNASLLSFPVWQCISYSPFSPDRYIKCLPYGCALSFPPM